MQFIKKKYRNCIYPEFRQWVLLGCNFLFVCFALVYFVAVVLIVCPDIFQISVLKSGQSPPAKWTLHQNQCHFLRLKSK